MTSWEEGFFSELSKIAEAKAPVGLKIMYVGEAFGAGHKAQAKNIAVAAADKGVGAELIDFNEAFGKKSILRPYEKSIASHLKKNSLSSAADVAMAHVGYYANGINQEKLKQFIDDNKDHAFILTHPHLRLATRDVEHPMYVLHTDPKLWSGEGLQAKLFPDAGPRIHMGTQEAMDELQPKKSVRLSGLPINPQVFAKQKPTGLMSKTGPNITVSAGGLGLEIVPMVKEVLKSDLPEGATIHAVAGRNERALKALEQLAKKDTRLKPIGFAPLAAMMREADLNVIRAHGTSFEETRASGKPAAYYAPDASILDFQGKLTKDTADYGAETVGHPKAIGLSAIPSAVNKVLGNPKAFARKAEAARKSLNNPAAEVVDAAMRKVAVCFVRERR